MIDAIAKGIREYRASTGHMPDEVHLNPVDADKMFNAIYCPIYGKGDASEEIVSIPVIRSRLVKQGTFILLRMP